MLTLEEKIELIENSKNIDELTLDVIPPTYSENYYFVSYSHKDYKKVFKEILLLQSKGISLWYDRGMRPGKDWKEIAETMIDKYACKGVIFFVSENLVVSKACAEEMEYVNKTGKSFCSINLAASDNNIYSAAELCEMINIPEEHKKIITSIFPSSVLYLSENDSIEKKSEGLLKLKEPPLFSYAFYNEKKSERLTNLFLNEAQFISQDDEWITIPNDIEEKEIPKDDLPFMINNIFHYAQIRFSYNNDMKTLIIPGLVYSNIDGTLCAEPNEHSIKNKIIKIERCCFANSIKLKNVIMSDSIEQIEESAFQGCTHLNSVEISNKVREIHDYTFYNCLNLTEINLSNIIKVGKKSFSECKKISNINLENCKFIEDKAFYGCESLTTIILSNKIKKLGAFVFFKCHNLENINTTFNLETVPDYCFYECYKLDTIKFNEDLSIIEGKAFSNCKSLKNFNFTKNIKTIGCGSFEKCISLTKLYFNDNLIEIGSGAFRECENLKEIHFGKNLTNIMFGSFRNCINLTEIILPENIEFIGRAAFSDCTNLKKIIIPKNCKHLGEMLSNNPNLNEIIYEGTLEEWSNVNGFDHLFIEEYPFMLSNEEIDLNTISGGNIDDEFTSLNLNKKYYEVICTDGIYKNIK